MKVSGLLQRIPVVLGLAALFLALTATRSPAAPVEPDILEMLNRAERPRSDFAPSRAGWNGPELPRRAAVPPPGLAPSMTADAFRNALIAAALPDWRVLAAIVAMIVILRRLRQAAATPRPAEVRGAEPPQQLAA